MNSELFFNTQNTQNLHLIKFHRFIFTIVSYSEHINQWLCSSFGRFNQCNKPFWGVNRALFKAF